MSSFSKYLLTLPAPREPITIKTNFLVAESPKVDFKTIGAFKASSLHGLPVKIALSFGNLSKEDSNETPIKSQCLLKYLLDFPGKAFCSCKKVL